MLPGRPVFLLLVVATLPCAGALIACGHAWCTECPEGTESSPPPTGPVSNASNAGGVDAASPQSMPPACSWPVSLDPPDARNTGWSVSRTLLVCGDPNAGPSLVC